MRLHLSQLAEQAGHALDVTQMAGPAWIRASIRGLEGDERPLANLIAGALVPERWLRPDDALAELAAAVEQGKLDIRAKTRAIAGLLGKLGSAELVRHEVAGLRQGMGRLAAATDLVRPLEELRGTEGLIPVRAGGRVGAAGRAGARHPGGSRTAARWRAAAWRSGRAGPCGPSERAGYAARCGADDHGRAPRPCAEGRRPMGRRADAHGRAPGRARGAQGSRGCCGEGRRKPGRGA